MSAEDVKFGAQQSVASCCQVNICWIVKDVNTATRMCRGWWHRWGGGRPMISPAVNSACVRARQQIITQRAWILLSDTSDQFDSAAGWCVGRHEYRKYLLWMKRVGEMTGKGFQTCCTIEQDIDWILDLGVTIFFSAPVKTAFEMLFFASNELFVARVSSTRNNMQRLGNRFNMWLGHKQPKRYSQHNGLHCNATTVASWSTMWSHTPKRSSSWPVTINHAKVLLPKLYLIHSARSMCEARWPVDSGTYWCGDIM